MKGSLYVLIVAAFCAVHEINPYERVVPSAKVEPRRVEFSFPASDELAGPPRPEPAAVVSPIPETAEIVVLEPAIATGKYDDRETDDAVSDVMSDVAYMTSKWQVYRDTVYRESIGLGEADLDRIRDRREFFQQIFDGLAKKLENGTSEKKDEVIKEILTHSKAYNESVEAIVGKEKFSALLEWRDKFNSEIRNQVRTGVEVSSFW